MQKEEVYSRDGLPLSMLYKILPRLPMKDILRCRCVCKTWRDLLQDPCFIDLLSRRSDISENPPCIVEIDSKRCYFRNIVSSDNGWWGGMKISDNDDNDDIRRAMYLASCNGLICISDLYNDAVNIVFNPITREKIRLPDYEKPEGSEFEIGFGFDKINNCYKLIIDLHPVSDVVPIVTVGESSWRNLHDIPSQIRECLCKRQLRGVFFDGRLHWIFGRYNHNYDDPKFLVEGTLTLDFTTEKFQNTMFSPPLEVHEEARLIQLGNSIGLFHQNYHHPCDRDYKSGNHKPKVIELWNILGAKHDGSCDYQYKTLNFPDHQDISFDNSYSFELLTVLGNEELLFKAFHPLGSNYLVVYDQEKGEPTYVQDLEIKGHITLGTFLPSLMSPVLTH